MKRIVIGLVVVVALAAAGGAAFFLFGHRMVVSESERELLARVDREHWAGELALKEGKVPLAGLLTGDPSRLDASFAGTPPGNVELAELSPGEVAHVVVPASAEADRDTFAAAWTRFRTGLGAVRRTELHFSRVHLEDDHLELEVDAELVSDSGGRRRDDAMRWKAALVRDQHQEWWLRSLTIAEHRVVVAEPVFTDVREGLPASASEAAEPGTFEFNAKTGVALADWDGDGDLDIYAARRNRPPLFYANDGAGTFSDVSEAMRAAANLGDQSGHMAVFFDADNDGDLDWVHIGPDGGRYVYREGNRFIDGTPGSGFDELGEGHWSSIGVVDYDGDGRLDVYLARRASFLEVDDYFDAHGEPNVLMRNMGGGRFADRTEQSGMGVGNDRYSYAVGWGDYNDDNQPDLYVANDFGPNKLYTNLGLGRFREEAEALGVEDPGAGMGVSWADLDNDGDLDLYVSNMHSYAGERIVNSPGFAGDDEEQRLAARFAYGNRYFRNTGDGFEEADVGIANAGWAWGQAIFDYDFDGDLDVYVANGFFSGATPDDT